MTDQDREAAIEAEVQRVAKQARGLLVKIYQRTEEDGDTELMFREWGVLGIMNWNEGGDPEESREDIILSFENKNAHVQIGMLNMAKARKESGWA